MQRYSFATALLALCILASTASAQYWFQVGAQGSSGAQFNQGARITIETVNPQNVTVGSLGYWVGETLSNGAFIQVGYEVPNQTNNYATNCGPSKCTGSVFVSANTPTWFWEYFPANYNGNSFYGGIGPNDSVGNTGAFNNYSFQSNGTTWNVFFNSNMIGSVNLGTGSSGSNPPLAISEYADATSGNLQMADVTFKNLQYFDGSGFRYVPNGYTYTGYGKGSSQSVSVPYGVQEVGGMVNYFQTGSGIAILPQYTLLWNLGYAFTVSSQYGNINSTGRYTAYAPVQLQAPTIVNISSTQREVFQQWVGYGSGSYTGKSPTATVTASANITEVAQWKTQYYLNATSAYGNVTGAGWYYANATATVSVPQGPVVFAPGERAVFSRWSNNAQTQSIQVLVDGPENVSAVWGLQYLVNATSMYGNVTGNGWYDANNTVTVKLNNQYKYINGTARLAFTEWSNGYNQGTITQQLTAPLIINAEFATQYLVSLNGLNANGQQITINNYDIQGMQSNGTIFLFANRTYTVDYASYKGVRLELNHSISNFAAGQRISFELPVYNVNISTYSIIKTPINATLNITFENNTRLITGLGPSGSITLYNVPDGYAYGYADYLGERQSVSIANGSAGAITFLTPLVFAGVFLVLAAVFIIERIIFAEIKMKNRQKQPKRKTR